MKILEGDLLRIARMSKGWTLKELSKRSTISISYLSHAENNRRNIPSAVRAVLDIEKETEWLIILLSYLDDIATIHDIRVKEIKTIKEKLGIILSLHFNS